MNPMREHQAASAVLLVRPVAFHANPETAASNAFQRTPGGAGDFDAQQVAAAAEFDGFETLLREAGVEVVVVPDTANPPTPDAIFPNNWVSFHADGTVVLYPMMAPSRRLERRHDILEHLSRSCGFHVERVIDLSARESEERFLESTGSMVLDRANHVAYACLSARTDLQVFAEVAQVLGYDPIAFAAVDAEGVPVYHTNVLMSIGADFAVVCEEAITDAGQRAAVERRLRETGHEVIPIRLDQMSRFAGNVLEVAGRDGERLLVLSAEALDALEPAQRVLLEARCRLLVAPIATIEAAGGGSVRCMIAEIHLPRRA